MKKFYIVLCVLIAACFPFEKHHEFQIKNTQNETLYVEVDGLQNASHKKLAFLQHGLASNMDHPVIQKAKQAFLDNGYTVVTFDSRYSMGKSGDDVQKVRLSTFEEDLETVTNWAKDQPFYHEPFALAGHSLGGASVLQYGARHPEKVNILVPVTPVISGDLWEKSCMKRMPDFCRQWKEKGTYEYTDTKDNKTVTIPYSVITDSVSYNAYNLIPKIKAQTLIIGAQNDNIIAPQDIKNLVEILNDKQLVLVIQNSGHNFNTPQNQNDLYLTVRDFIK